MANTYWIESKQVVTEEGIQSAAVLVSDGLIQCIASTPNTEDPVIQTDSNHYLMPGMIDMHIHGACDADVMDATDDSLKIISNALAQEGATAFLATTMTESPERIESALSAVKARMDAQTPKDGAEILGVHLEGPFIAPAKMGAQNATHIQEPNADVLKNWIEKTGVKIALVSMAPEQPGATAFIEYCRANDIVVSIGHTNASFEQAKQSFDDGITHATHLYNAMSGFSHRDPGVAAAVLDDQRVLAELIADGIHVHSGVCALTLKIKGVDRLALVTDAMRAKCMPDGEYSLGGQKVIVKEGAARLENGTLAGGVLKMNQALANILKFTGCSIEEAVCLVSVNPAKQLGVYDQKGSIAVGKQADLVLFNKQFEVVSTWCRGEQTYENKEISQ